MPSYVGFNNGIVGALCTTFAHWGADGLCSGGVRCYEGISRGRSFLILLALSFLVAPCPPRVEIFIDFLAKLDEKDRSSCFRVCNAGTSFLSESISLFRSFSILNHHTYARSFYHTRNCLLPPHPSFNLLSCGVRVN